MTTHNTKQEEKAGMSTNELKLRTAHMLHRVVSFVNRISQGENLEKFEVGLLHDDIYQLFERPDI